MVAVVALVLLLLDIEDKEEIMSKIIAKDHFETSNWEVIFQNIHPYYADLYIGFTNEGPVIEFKDLKFKYELKLNGDVVQSNSFPPENTKYVNTDQDYVVSERLVLEAGNTYELYLWAENDGVSFEKTTQFTTPSI